MMNGVELEDVVCGRTKHLVALREDHGLEHVHGLRDVGHVYAVGVVVENVQYDRCGHCITECVLLIQEGRIGSGLGLMPHTPLADDQPYALCWIEAVHDCRVAGDDCVKLRRLLHQLRPLGFREDRRATLLAPSPREDIAMEVESVDQAPRLAHNDFCPTVRLVGGARRDAKGTHRPVRWKKAHEALVDVGVILGAHVSTASPALVADSPEMHVPRLRSSVASAKIGHRTGAGMVYVLPPFRHLLHASTADISHDEWLGAELLSELEEFVRADAVVLGDTAPVVVDDCGPELNWPNTVLPMVVVGETAAGPAQIRDLDRAERLHDVFTRGPAAGAASRKDPIVHAAAEVFSEVAVDVTTDRVAPLIGVDDQRLRRLRRCRIPEEKARDEESREPSWNHVTRDVEWFEDGDAVSTMSAGAQRPSCQIWDLPRISEPLRSAGPLKPLTRR